MCDSNDQLELQKLEREIAKLDLELVEMRKSQWRRIAESTKTIATTLVGALGLFYGCTSAKNARDDANAALTDKNRAQVESAAARTEAAAARTEAAAAKVETATSRESAKRANDELAVVTGNLAKAKAEADAEVVRTTNLRSENDKIMKENQRMARVNEAQKADIDQLELAKNALNAANEKSEALIEAAKLAARIQSKPTAERTEQEKESLAQAQKAISAVNVVTVEQHKWVVLPKPLNEYAIGLEKVSASKATELWVFKYTASLTGDKFGDIKSKIKDSDIQLREAEIRNGDSFELVLGSTAFLVKPTIVTRFGADAVQFIIEPK